MNTTAGSHALINVPTVTENATCGDALALLKGGTYDYSERVYLLTNDRRLKGWMRVSELFSLREDEKLLGLMNTSWPVVLPDADQEHLASVAIEYDSAAVPVVDEEQRFLGVVPARAIIRILRDEHIEDLHRMSGITRQIGFAQESETELPVTRARHRLPWLVMGLVGSMLATYLMTSFEGMLRAHIALAFFIPGIVYLADAIGTQSETIAIRGLSLHRLSFREMVLREVKTGVIIGLVLSLIYFPFSWAMFNDLHLAWTVSMAILIAGGIATTVGILLPSLLSSFRIDPAFGSGPIGTIIQDILSMLTYFLVARIMLG
jgi:magnesium transporter